MAVFQAALSRVCDVFQISSLFSEQEECLKALCDGKDVYASLPTGYGKSLIFYALPIVMDVLLNRPQGSSKVIIISPLKTLMEDQVNYLKTLGISAIALHDEQSEDAFKAVENGSFSYLFASPERMLNSGRWRRLLSSAHYREFLAAVAIDEAHCISQWGVSTAKAKQASLPFRQWYGNLGEINSLVSNDVPTLVLTATASKGTKKDIFSTLNLSRSTFVLERSPEKPNICFGAQYLDNNSSLRSIFHSIIEEVRNEKGNCQRTMIFCQTRKQCALVYSTFMQSLDSDVYVDGKPNPKQRRVEMFHAGTPSSVKKHVLQNFSQPDGHIRVLACTVAFGMGVDCKGVHRVIHFGPSKNLECYVQECGRAGRDGKASKCVLLHNGLLAAHCSEDIKDYVDIDYATECRRKLIYKQFPGNFTSTVTGHRCCDVCAKSCTCGGTDCVKETQLIVEVSSPTSVPCDVVRQVDNSQKERLNVKLHEYMDRLVLANKEGPIVSSSIFQEFTKFHIKQVLKYCEQMKILQDVLLLVEVWRREHAVAILQAINEVFGDVDNDELETVETHSEDDEDFDAVDEEWANLRDDSELCNLLCDSDFTNVDVQMEEIDQSGMTQRSASSFIDNLRL